MKILELRFKNLNSLYGEWKIDFTSPEYVSNGIFALTGPTGAGKSTILDAICLGLYGATPRLGKITKSANEIMSRQTGECYAEVLFESQAVRYRCHWEQRRARKRADGNLQDQEHQIVDEATQKPIETKKSLVGGVIEEKTGMDFDRFTRSILLAQGGFDTFLKADPEQKSKILEQITGTEIYSDISRRTHERLTAERNELNLLEAETAGIVLLESEKEAEAQDELETRQKLEVEFSAKLNATATSIAWLTTIESLKNEVHNLLDEEANLRAEIDAFLPERGKLAAAIKAASLDGVHATLIALRDLQRDEERSMQNEKAALPDLETAANVQTEALKAAEHHTSKNKDDLEAAAPLIQKVRSLDQKISDQAKAISGSYEQCASEAAKIEADKQIRTEKLEPRTAAGNRLKIAEQFLAEHTQDKWLVGGLAGIEEQLKNLVDKQKETARKEKAIQKADAAVTEATGKLAAAKTRSAARRQELASAAQKLQEGNDALGELLAGKLLREHRDRHESLLRELAYIRIINDLEDHRAKLEDGKECPLCGALEHPFAKGNIPSPDETDKQLAHLSDLITRAEQQEAVIGKLKDAEITTRQRLGESERLEGEAAGGELAAIQSHAVLKNDVQTLRDDFEKLMLAVSEKLQPLGIVDITESEVSSLLKSLKSRLSAWQEQVKAKAGLEKRIADIDAEISRLDAVIEAKTSVLTEKRENLEQLTRTQTDIMDERKKVYGDKSPDAEESRLKQAVLHAEQAEKEARRLDHASQQKVSAAKNRIESLEKRLKEREPELHKAEAEFSKMLETTGFADEKLFLTAVLPTEERESLSLRARKLDHAQTELNSKRKDREARLATENAKNITDKPLDELQAQLKDDETAAKGLREAIAGLKHKLEENASAKNRIKEKQAAIEAQKKEYRIWEKLHTLIGSADGKKYRNFAQGLTFEIMVSHANRQLEKMSDRYLLVRDEQQPLELNVVDNYQAGEIRSTKNLSGGESFIVSLTLALGLSKMASRKVRVDSLFLDEGFGTLDEEALETALETLSGLHQDGKLIGIISHVSALKERISTQITITPISGGRSSLSGPGCTNEQKVVNEKI